MVIVGCPVEHAQSKWRSGRNLGLTFLIQQWRWARSLKGSSPLATHLLKEYLDQTPEGLPARSTVSIQFIDASSADDSARIAASSQISETSVANA